MRLSGLTQAEAYKRQSLGLANSVIDSYSPSYSQIVLKNVFSLINVIITPLLVLLAVFGLWTEVLALSMFIVINTITSVADEIRIKKEIAKLKNQFQITAKVVRDEETHEIPASSVVKGDLVIAEEGDSIIADGVVAEADYLQIDESNLTGESDYIRKEKDTKVYSGSFVVTGTCYYYVDSIGTDNYTNKIASATTKFEKVKSPMQKNADKLISFLIFAAIFLGLLNFIFTGFNETLSMERRLLSVTTITTLIIPQTLIFLFTLTFIISISKLFKKGVLVQKGAAIETLTNIDIVCLDKTGTITTNKMLFKDFVGLGLNEKMFAKVLNSVRNNLFGVNKTLKVLLEKYFEPIKEVVSDFHQIPFNSKDKFSLISGILKNEKNEPPFTFVLGAFEVLKPQIEPTLQKEVAETVNAHELKGFRVLCCLQFDERLLTFPAKKTKKVAVYVFEEELNYGISALLKRFNELKIAVKIISGDSFGSVSKVASKVGLENAKIVDLNATGIDFNEAAEKFDIFTRAKPDDKLKLITYYKSQGKKVAMVGDGINDVLGLKAADVSIAMESGAKVARSIADMVLLNNDYSKIPDVFYEGDNIIFNLKISTKMFLAKSIFAIILAAIATAFMSAMPLFPSSTLVFSFLSSSLPSYIVIFTRSKTIKSKGFFKEVINSALNAGIILSLVSLCAFLFQGQSGLNETQLNTAIVLLVLGTSLVYSLILLWQSGKLKSIGMSLFAFIVAFLAGVMQTVLPLGASPDPLFLAFVVLILAIGVCLLAWALFTKFKPASFIKKAGLALLSIIWVPVVLVFPFGAYYHVAKLPFEYYPAILGMIVIAGGLIILSGKVADSFKK